jgi:hypothetical protein
MLSRSKPPEPLHRPAVGRKKHFPKVLPSNQINSVLSIAELVAQDMRIGPLVMFLAQQRKDLCVLSDEIEECQTQLWLLTHTESRHLPRMFAVL